MSGGSFNYTYCTVDQEYSGYMKDEELNALIKDLVEVLHDLEWWQSADICEEHYRETVTKFKNKWLKQYNKEKCYEYCPHKSLTEAVKQNLKIIEQLEPPITTEDILNDTTIISEERANKIKQRVNIRTAKILKRGDK